MFCFIANFLHFVLNAIFVFSSICFLYTVTAVMKLYFHLLCRHHFSYVLWLMILDNSDADLCGTNQGRV